jgi:GNAT superfamily N-acetyltransferase
MQVEPTCVAEMNSDPHYDELLEDYNLHKGQGNPGMKAGYLLSLNSRRNYHALEQAGMLMLFRAMHEDRLIGIISVLDVPGGQLAMVESLYVIDRYRTTGAGNALLGAAKAFCRARAVTGMIISAEPGGVIDRKLTRDKKTVISKLYYIDL